MIVNGVGSNDIADIMKAPAEAMTKNTPPLLEIYTSGSSSKESSGNPSLNTPIGRASTICYGPYLPNDQ